MAPSASGLGDGAATVRKLLREVLEGREDPGVFFATCVSVLGHQETLSRFPALIRPLSAANGSLHGDLASIYRGYFSKVSGVIPT